MNAIRTQRLALEPVTTRNAAILWRLMQSAHLREFQDVPRYTREEFERRVAARPLRLDTRASGRFEWIVSVAETERPIGWISLRVGDHARGVAEIGYSILSSHRGRGYAGEATRAVVAAAFATSDLRRIEACCVPANAASRRLLATLGFDELRVQKNGAVVRGRPVDICVFEMTRERWTASDPPVSAARRTRS